MNAINITTATTLRLGSALLLGCVLASPASAKIAVDQIARLGVDLTPLGGDRAGNADGTIPEWTGGITEPPAGYKVGEHHRDPYAGDEPRFVIDAANLDEYRDRLSVGHQRILETYPSFNMPVYPTRRSASVPQRIYDATRNTAATAKLVDGGNGVADAVIGIPFPIPQNGLEVIWNHLLRYRGETVACVIGQAAVTRGGAYTLVKQSLEIELRYSLPHMTLEELGNTMVLFKQKTLAPARLAGDIVLVHETMNQFREPAQRLDLQPGSAPGAACPEHRLRQPRNVLRRAAHRRPARHVQRRRGPLRLDARRQARDIRSVQLVPVAQRRSHVHRHPQAPARQPGTAALRAAPGVGGGSDTQGGATHTYKRRTLYVDEDSWQILVADIYDNRDQLWRVSEATLSTTTRSL